MSFPSPSIVSPDELTASSAPNTSPIKFQSDPLNSTYRWEFFMSPGHARNKVALIEGYSKGMGYENTNKVVLLQRKLVNPVLPYLERCEAIIIYEQVAGRPKDCHVKLLELYSNHFRAFGWVQGDVLLNNFLKDYYAVYLKTGAMPSVEDRRKNVRQKFYMDDLDHAKRNFSSHLELQQFCRERVVQYSEACMRGWYYKHALFQPELFENNVTQAVATAPVVADVPVEQVKRSMNALLTKHTANSTRS